MSQITEYKFRVIKASDRSTIDAKARAMYIDRHEISLMHLLIEKHYEKAMDIVASIQDRGDGPQRPAA